MRELTTGVLNGGTVASHPTGKAVTMPHGPDDPSHNNAVPSAAPEQQHDGDLQTRPSNYGHHRQISIVQGVQHSRNPSLAGWATTAVPLSAELIASAGRPSELVDVDTVAPHQVDGPAVDTVSASSPVNNNLPRRVNTAVGRPLRERSHSRSRSAQHNADTKSVGEYALHHLFNSVRHYCLARWCCRANSVSSLWLKPMPKWTRPFFGSTTPKLPSKRYADPELIRHLISCCPLSVISPDKNQDL